MSCDIMTGINNSNTQKIREVNLRKYADIQVAL